ncbi:efflux RND transporter periplasmic adaptor subunit [Parashewanella tropica]|uniref:efflux RND transporter periplasmic adaptor subunit n=1 Tax=Parashewanella tropica TaxID=2547970 RepID=UPI001FE63EB2|nr:efflux RND transporter periplasmic adaptor subunit [Parashewanella tropica]
MMRYSFIALLWLGTLASAFAANHDHSMHQVLAPKAQYVCPMHAHIKKDHEGTCPICGMDLVKSVASENTNTPSISVSGDMQQALSIKVSSVKRQTLWQYVKTTGIAKYDERKIHHQHARVSGWIEKLAVSSIGEQIKQGQLLYQLYSPELITAQDDFLLTLNTYEKNPSSRKYAELLEKSRTRLLLLGISPKQIQQLQKQKQSQFLVNYYAKQAGVIKALNVREGMYIEPKTEVLAIASTNDIWVVADIYDANQPWLTTGITARVKPVTTAGETRIGKVEYLYPDQDPVTRSSRARIVFESSSVPLKHNALVDVELLGGAKHHVLTIPQHALIQTGTDNRVIVKTSDNTFEARGVTTGLKRKGLVEVLSGVKEGDQVVVSGQFLLDSESSLRGGLERLSSAHQH